MSIAIGKNQKVFIVPETNLSQTDLVARIATPAEDLTTDEGVMHLMLTAGEGSVNQEREKLPDKRLRGGRSKRTDLPARYNPGTFSLPAYMCTRLNGVNQLATELDTLLTGIMGERDAIPAVSNVTEVEYRLTDRVSTFNVWFQKDHTVFCCVGATANQCETNVNGTDFGMFTFSGEFMRMFRGGTATLKTAIAIVDGATVAVALDTGQAARFDEGMYISIDGQVDDTLTVGTGYQILSIDYSTDILTLAGVGITAIADIAVGAVVKGFIPNSTQAEYVAYVDADPIHSKRGLLSIYDGVNPARDITVLTCKLSINNNVKYSTDEKNGMFYASDYFNSEFREIKGDLTLYFRDEDTRLWYDALENVKYSLTLPVGDQAGQIFEFTMPNIRFNSPTVSGENEVQLTTSFSVGRDVLNNDELTVTIK